MQHPLSSRLTENNFDLLRLLFAGTVYQWAGPAGEPVYLDVVLTALGAGSGRIDGYLAHCLDISARKRAEAALQQAQAILETTPSILYVFDGRAAKRVYQPPVCERPRLFR